MTLPQDVIGVDCQRLGRHIPPFHAQTRADCQDEPGACAVCPCRRGALVVCEASDGYDRPLTAPPAKAGLAGSARGSILIRRKTHRQFLSPAPAATTIPAATAKQQDNQYNDEKGGDVHDKSPVGSELCTSAYSSRYTLTQAGLDTPCSASVAPPIIDI